MIRMADLNAQTKSLQPALDERIKNFIETSAFIGGSEVKAFEHDFGTFTQTKNCIGVGNGTDALEIILEALEVGPGDEVIVPAFSFAATSEAVLRTGAYPVFSDIDDRLLMNPENALNLVTNKTRAIIPVHLFGNPFDVRQLDMGSNNSNVYVIEDAAQAHGASVRGAQVGSLATAAAFSFYPGKNLGAWGDAGGITTNESEIASRARRIANHGRLDKFDHEILGRNSRLDSIQALILTEKLKKLEEWVNQRRANAHTYLKELNDIEWLKLPTQTVDSNHAWHLFVIQVLHREDFRKFLLDQGIETGIHYPYTLPSLPFHRGRLSGEKFENAQHAARTVVSIPVGEHLSEGEILRVVSAIRNYKPARK